MTDFPIKHLAEMKNLKLFIECTGFFARNHGFKPEKINEILVVVEEIIVNIISYGFQDRDPGEIELKCDIDNTRRLKIEIIDTGSQFNILEADPPDMKTDLKDMAFGGLGILLVRKLSDDIFYQYKEKKNHLTLFFKENEDNG